MIHHLLYYLDETDDKLAFNELDEPHDMCAYLYTCTQTDQMHLFQKRIVPKVAVRSHSS